jgi:hypothetical protein
MTLNIYKISFLIFSTICVFLLIPERKAEAIDYMFCPIFSSNGSPYGNGCFGSMDDCNRMSRPTKYYQNLVICVAKPKTSNMQQ